MTGTAIGRLRGGTAGKAGLLATANVAAAALGMVQTLIVARELGTAQYGTVGVLAAGVGVVANFIDIRLPDLAVRLYGEAGEDSGQRRRVLQGCLAVNAAIGALLAGLAVVVGALVAPAVQDVEVPLLAVVLSAVVGGTLYVLNTIVYLIRLTGRFATLAATRVASQGITAVVVIVAVMQHPSLGAYYSALAVSTAGMLVVSTLIAVHAFRRAAVGPLDLLGYRERGMLAVYRPHLRLLALTNAFAYSKLLHRAADVLVVGAFADDRATGVYKLARSLTDGLYLLYDAVNQVEFPRLLGLLIDGSNQAFRRSRRRLVLAAIGVTVAALSVTAVAFNSLVNRFGLDAYSGGRDSVLLLLVPFLFVAGVHLWVWPMLMQTGRLGRFTALAFLAALLQTGVTALGMRRAPDRVEIAAAAYALYYVVLYLPTAAAFWPHPRAGATE